MSRVRFHAIKELSKLVYVKYWGVGYDNYDNTKTVQENIDTLEYKYDIVIAYKPLEMLDFKNVNIPKCIRYNEMFDIDFTKNEIIESGANIVIAHHENEMKYYESMQNIEFHYLPHCAKNDIFKNNNVEKSIDLLLVGSVWDRYPLRIRFLKIINKLKDKYKVDQFKHPGYELTDADNDEHLKDFVREINKAKIVLSCSGKYKSRYGKYVEVPMCGAALAADIPDSEQESLKKFIIEIDLSMSDDEIIAKLEYYLENSDKLDKIRKAGEEWSKKYNQKYYAENLLNIFYKYLKKDRNMDPNIQSLWIGGELSNLEILSMKSFLHNNHNYYLYTYNNIPNVPEGVIVKDGNDILPESEIFRYKNGSVSAFSNVFRYKMIFDKGGYWVDTDLICLKYFDFTDEYILSCEPINGYQQSKLNPCIMKAPRLSIPMFEGFKICLNNKQNVLDGKIEWDLGPSSLLNVVKNLNLIDYVKPWKVFNLFEPSDWYAGILSSKKVKDFTQKHNFNVKHLYYNDINSLPKENYAVHFYNEIWRNSEGLNKNYKFEEGCLYEQLKEKYNVKTLSNNLIKFNLDIKDNQLQFNLELNQIN